MADDATLERLRLIASSRRVSLATVVREALEAKAATYLPRPKSLGAGESSPARKAAGDTNDRQPPRSWR